MVKAWKVSSARDDLPEGAERNAALHAYSKAAAHASCSVMEVQSELKTVISPCWRSLLTVASHKTFINSQTKAVVRIRLQR